MPTTAASVGTAASKAYSDVPDASTGISPSKASCTARSQYASRDSLVSNHVHARWAILTDRDPTTVGAGRARATLADVIDTHCHLDVAAFAADRDAVIARATAAGVTGMVIPAIRPCTWDALRALAAQH